MKLNMYLWLSNKSYIYMKHISIQVLLCKYSQRLYDNPNRKQYKYFCTGEWVNYWWCIHMIKYYLTLKGMNYWTYKNMGEFSKHCAKWNKPDILYDSIYMKIYNSQNVIKTGSMVVWSQEWEKTEIKRHVWE
jgi:hypothetical protein